MWLLAAGCAFVAGVAIAATRDPLWAAVLCPVVGFAFLLSNRTRTTVALLVACVGAFALLGAIRYDESIPEDWNAFVSSWNGSEPVTIQAVVAEEPEQGSRYTQVLLDDVHVEQSDGLRPVEGRVLVTTPDPRPLHYGDTVSLHGSLEEPRQLGDFDYAAYLARQGVYSTLFCQGISVVPTGNRRTVTSTLLSLNRRLGDAMARALPEPESSLAQSLLLGRRGRLPDAVMDAFTRTGTVHLLSISGLHLAVVAAAVLAVILAAAGRRHYLYVCLGIVALWTYALFTGMKPPVVRAAIMLTVFLLAELAGRQRHAPTALALAAAVMVGIEPQVLWQTSFQLSVLAMGGLVLLYGPIRALLVRCLDWVQRHTRMPPIQAGAAADITAATIAATVAVWPASAGTFGQISLVGVPASLLTLPILPFALASASAAAVIALASPILVTPFAWVAWMFLSCIIGVVEALSSISVATTGTQAWADGFIAGYYAVLVAAAVLWQRSRRPDDERHAPPAPSPLTRPVVPRWALPSLAMAAVLVWSAVLSAPDGRLHVVFLDVGQGDATLVVTPTGRTVLIDGGADGQQTCTLVDRYLPFWDRSIDVVVATHPHVDHLGGLLSVVERYDVGLVLDSPVESASLPSAEWERRIADSNATREHATAGQELSLGDGTSLTILNPAASVAAGVPDADDNNGVVLRLSYGDVSFLFAADIRAEREVTLLHRGAALQANVLKVPHHGSNTSACPQFLTAVNPDVAIVSVGAENRYGHPHPSVLEALAASGAAVLTTQDCGTIELVTDGHGLSVRTGIRAPAADAPAP
ncbi:MAG: ComEC/Rec2 family competence protein [Dehalococcoidia bacterium]|jgi:competence protein ComEC|nr:ComEC/Rec2 family competence protein [Dehalococcoidia bacterium]